MNVSSHPMIWLQSLLLIALAAGAFLIGRNLARRRSAGQRANSLPGHHGSLALIWALVPALLILIGGMIFDARIERSVLWSAAPASIQLLDAPRKAAFVEDARRVGRGETPLQIWVGPQADALQEEGARAARIQAALGWGGLIAIAIAGLLGALAASTRVRPLAPARDRLERWIGGLLFVCSAVAILTTIGIVASLLFESMRFFSMVPVQDFLFGTQWSPQIAIRADQVGSSGAFGALPLFAGTFLIMIIAMLVAGPIGLFSAIYLSEYAGPRFRAIIKPVLEILAGVPTVVYGFFAALSVGPALRSFFNWLGALMAGGPLDGIGQHLMLVQNQMALVAGCVMGIMLIPFVSSLSDDIINAVPQSLRDGSYAMGATKSETVKKVVLPAALPGIAAAFLLAISRAIGETMIVTMAAGLAARLTLNVIALRIVQKYRVQYD